jgi:hypothetical protein
MVGNPPPAPPRNFLGTLTQPRKLIFGMQPYLTTKTTQTNGFDTIEIDLVISILGRLTGLTFSNGCVTLQGPHFPFFFTNQ